MNECTSNLNTILNLSVKTMIHNWLHQQNETFFYSCIIAALYVGMNVWNLVETNKISIEILLLAVFLCIFLCSIMRKHFSEKKKFENITRGDSHIYIYVHSLHMH
jgi:hypothetical protein